MGKARPQMFRPAMMIVTLGWIFVGASVRVAAQDHTPDPYKPYNAQYDAFSFPTYPNPEGYMPNQGILQGRSAQRGANQFQNYLNEVDGIGGRGSGLGVPYYRSNRRYYSEYDRENLPIATADDRFFAEQELRHKKYLEYLRERDPKKRARLYREYTDASKKSSRELLSPRRYMSRKATTEDVLDDEDLDYTPKSVKTKKPTTSSTSPTRPLRSSTPARTNPPTRATTPKPSNSTKTAKPPLTDRTAKPRTTGPVRPSPSSIVTPGP